MLLQIKIEIKKRCLRLTKTTLTQMQECRILDVPLEVQEKIGKYSELDIIFRSLDKTNDYFMQIKSKKKEYRKIIKEKREEIKELKKHLENDYIKYFEGLKKVLQTRVLHILNARVGVPKSIYSKSSYIKVQFSYFSDIIKDEESIDKNVKRIINRLYKEFNSNVGFKLAIYCEENELNDFLSIEEKFIDNCTIYVDCSQINDEEEL